MCSNTDVHLVILLQLHVNDSPLELAHMTARRCGGGSNLTFVLTHTMASYVVHEIHDNQDTNHHPSGTD